MRRPILIALPILLGSLLSATARADEAQKIISQYLKAVGGSKAVSRLQTLSIDGSVAVIGDAPPGTYTFKVKRPNRVYIELRANAATLIHSYNPKPPSPTSPHPPLGTP